MQLIGSTWYGSEMKKGIFSMINYLLPLKGIASMYCSANMGDKGDVAVFFGLSGTGKTTLSTDPNRLLISDDEYGWDDNGVFNFEGGCYAKTIKLSEEAEPDIYHAIKHEALLENVTVLADGTIDFNDSSKTENTRVSYPLYHIQNIVKPVSKAGPYYQGDLPDRRCLRPITAGITFDRRPDSVPFSIWLHRQTSWHRARHDRIHTDLLCLFQCCFPVVTPNSIR